MCDRRSPRDDALRAEQDGSRCLESEWCSSVAIYVFPQKWWIKVFTKDSWSHTGSRPGSCVFLGKLLRFFPCSLPALSSLSALWFLSFHSRVGLNLVIVTHTINIKFFHFLCSFTAAIHFFIIIISKPRLLQGPLCNPGYVYGSLQSAFHTHMPVLFLEQTHLLMASLVISITVCMSTQKLSTKIKFRLPE